MLRYMIQVRATALSEAGDFPPRFPTSLVASRYAR